ncbi:chromosome partition protein MukB [Vibrio sp. WJH972]
MIERGKYQSLTMINWNGFFARTFDIDNLVTTLSGGNGAGKSTTMAAFITALIPDQSLLHFRNTTEAGSSQASRDKGLYGKLQAGVCYSVLDVVNSRKQRVLFAVKLQQVAGRDKKVDIKPFIIQGLPSAIKPTDVLIETISDQQARVRPLNEVKDTALAMEGVQFKALNSIVDYHSLMFEFGVLPKKMRNSSDRGKFYRLIEASLYGGISSAITRSLRDYLLPQNGGVKKAFQDMEAALRENRMTLEAIKTTQSDRDLFKHLISESTNYVAADYMRHANDRRKQVDQVLAIRNDLFLAQKSLIDQNQLLVQANEELTSLVDLESGLEQDYQSASDFLQQVQNALRQREKIERYRDDLEELSERLEEQLMIADEARDRLEIGEEQQMVIDDEVDSLKSQLADYQQALDTQQTRALQYQQATQALAQAQQLLEKPNLTLEQVREEIAQLSLLQESTTQEVLAAKHKIDISAAESQRFELAYQLIVDVVGAISREDARQAAAVQIEQWQVAKRAIEGKAQLSSLHRDLERQVRQIDDVKVVTRQYHNVFSQQLDGELALEQERERHEEVLESVDFELDKIRDEAEQERLKEHNARSQVSDLEAIAPKWLAANDALTQLSEQSGYALEDSQAVMSAMQEVLEKEQHHSKNKIHFSERRDQLEKDIAQLGAPGGGGDSRLKTIADTLGGVLLSEIYDDISLDDAPYFSAMYGPARHAIVLTDLDGIEQKLAELDECPDDLYLIEGDADAFDDSSFSVTELEGAVCVSLNQQQLRYSRYPELPLFGRAAREQRLETLREERDQAAEEYAKSAFDAQKLQRVYQLFNQFVAQHIDVAFKPNPDAALDNIRQELAQVTRRLAQLNEQQNEIKQRSMRAKEALALIDKVQSTIHLLDDDSILDRFDEVSEKLEHLREFQQFIDQHGSALEKLMPIVGVLESDPERFVELEENYHQADTKLKLIKSQLFALSDVQERRHYFSYSDSLDMVSKSGELSEQLKAKLTHAEAQRIQAREESKQAQLSWNESNQVLVSLKSSHQAKLETVQEFEFEMREAGIQADDNALERAETRKSELYERLQVSRSRKSELEKTTTSTELEMTSTAKRVKRMRKEYIDIRSAVVKGKSGWCKVLRLAKENDVERRLHRRELAYLSTDDLRSMSDKALGALRLAVANNEELRDALRLSEDNNHPERKVMFYIAVYHHLRQRIRQDIIKTDDPVEAIEEMEVELARLTDELTHREARLAISSDSVASIIRKTIQREQNRIRMLNQGLQNVYFGQVKGVRLNVKVRESHETLLTGLTDQQNNHKDLFETNRFTFSEAMAKLFQRVNPHIDMGQRSPQVLGEELLDYRNYLELNVEVNRGTDGWLQAESGALSTGEAIGTGQSILLMVVQSWEEESRRLRSKDLLPCRLLFLDEAARLDTKSIATLFELCDRLDMQLLIAAPENISPEKGTTYKLVRKVFNGNEHVHVVGLRGFGQGKPATTEPHAELA